MSLDRTQEVGGSNPPSSISVKSLHTGRFPFRPSPQKLSNRGRFLLTFQARVPETGRIGRD